MPEEFQHQMYSKFSDSIAILHSIIRPIKASNFCLNSAAQYCRSADGWEQNLFNSFPRYLFCTRTIWRIGCTVLQQDDMKKTARNWINSVPQNSSDAVSISFSYACLGLVCVEGWDDRLALGEDGFGRQGIDCIAGGMHGSTISQQRSLIYTIVRLFL